MAEAKSEAKSDMRNGGGRSPRTKGPAVPFAAHVLGFGIFAMVTSEFQVNGMITVMASDLDVGIAQVGYLVSIYALAMAFGGPLLTLALLGTVAKKSLMILYAIFICAESLGALAPS